MSKINLCLDVEVRVSGVWVIVHECAMWLCKEIPAAPQHNLLHHHSSGYNPPSVCTIQVSTHHHTSAPCTFQTHFFSRNKSLDNRMGIRGTFLQQKRSTPVRTSLASVRAMPGWQTARAGGFWLFWKCLDGKMD
ncbi:hypothetical protein FQA47_021768 [Oryzias melastigma]|uniref:Uncharacterized protein n=1 Tax=Oryzias melastigma TaxID=30732 RepID=A0A834BTL7_ORYME|nr:hypothetical protein FQA47_021768 [Oryzias melastigma]